MALYILKWGVGLIVLSVGVLFGLSLAMNTSSADIYIMSGATIISISFIILGANIFIMGLKERKKNKELRKNKQLLTKAEYFSTKKTIDSYRNIR
jgi:predicted dinucleotide-utilizing enzyme